LAEAIPAARAADCDVPPAIRLLSFLADRLAIPLRETADTICSHSRARVGECRIDVSSDEGGGAVFRDQRIHGELHNNLRMTWAKAIVPWRPDPEAALATLIDLNHRFALDGSDQNSYGGLL
jgi:hypothetical protein